MSSGERKESADSSKKSVAEPPKASIAGPPKASIAGPPKASIAGPPKASIAGPPKASIAEPPKASIAGPPKASIAGAPKASVAGLPKQSVVDPKMSVADPKMSVAGAPKPSIAEGSKKMSSGDPKMSIAEGVPDPKRTSTASRPSAASRPGSTGDAAAAAAAAAAAGEGEGEEAASEATPPTTARESTPPHGFGVAAKEARKSKDKDAPEKEKKRSTIVPIPTSGQGAIATADKGAVELGVKVKNFFNAAEGQRLKEEAQKPLRRPKKIYQNSYRFESAAPYSRDQVQGVLELTLEEMIKGVYYNSETAGDLAVRIAERIRSRVLSLRFERYKVIVMTNVGPLNRQGIHIGFRCLFDQERDTYNIATAKSTHAFVTAVVYGVYLE